MQLMSSYLHSVMLICVYYSHILFSSVLLFDIHKIPCPIAFNVIVMLCHRYVVSVVCTYQ